MTNSNVLILGSGPAGCTAAIYTARANMRPILISGPQTGGQLTITTDVENYPGFANIIQGPWLMEQMIAQAQRFGTSVVYDTITKAEVKENPFILTSDSGTIYSCEALIVCTGASARWLGIESEQRYHGFGVSACATCDGFFFRGKVVCVVGGGNTAVEEALYLSKLAEHVILIHRRDILRAERIMQERLLSDSKIQIIWNTKVEEILGTDSPLAVSGLRVRDVKTNVISDIDCDGVFIAIGHSPNTELFKEQLSLDATGYILTKPGSTATNIPGVFAAGDVQDPVYRQAVTAAGSGCMAALEAESFLSSQSKKEKRARENLASA